MTQIINEGWELKYLSITKNWGGNELHKYSGTITFENGKKDEMKFSIPPDKMGAILDLISDSIVASAKELGQGLVESIRPKQIAAPPETGSDNFIDGPAASGGLG